MRELIAGLPDQLRWAADLDPPEVAAAEEAVIAGMGGSGMAGTVASVIAEEAGRRVAVHRSYGLPGWSGRRRALVVAVSHSGNTEETLSAASAAWESGLDVAAVTAGGRLGAMAEERSFPVLPIPGGPQPRADVGCLTGGVLRILEAAGILPSQSEALREAADVVAGVLGGGGPELAADLAEALERRVAVVCAAAGVGAAAAARWKAQINENGKAPAYTAELPEFDHNEITGWTAWPDLSRDRIGVVWLRDPGEHPRVAQRFLITQQLIDDTTGIAGEVHARGRGPLARFFSLAVMGDLVSVAIAERAGVDPMSVAVIEELKRRLAGEGP